MKKKLFALIFTTILVLSLAGCSAASDSETSLSDTDTTATAASTEETAKNSVDTAATNSATTSTNSGSITVDEAKEIALSHAGLTEADVIFISANLDTDDGRQIYEVEFYSGTTEYDYDIDVTTGEIISYDYDVENYAISENQGTGSSETYIGEEEAKSIALAKVSGATESNIHLYLDYDDGVAVYEGTIVYNEVKYEFEIDAATGTVTSWESESVYDD